ncbi:hypothetical protein BSQ98_24680 [Serratia liquefaciens]|uniref:hypothetical protein n=1 Tax=Serratia TaxID=613 RepID=UPI001020642B|nr:hypothetical protein [Serratia liquefaciens]RYM58202.1 hypothetical protein BSQ98_24680 [Serratia liquefaciens]
MVGQQKKDGTVIDKNACQRERETFYRPECLSHLPSLPLYLMAAHWGWCTGNDLTAKAVHQAFRVETSRARAVLRYFSRFETQISFLRPRRGAVRILALPPMDIVDRRSSRRRRCAEEGVAELAARKVREQEQQRLRRWFLQRPNRVMLDE